MNDFMEVRRVLSMLLRRWWILIALMVLGAMIGYAISRQQTPVYEASTTVLVGESIKSSNVDRVDIQISEALIQTYVEIAQRQPVLQGVVTTLNLNESWQDLRQRISVTTIESTQLIEISVEANSPELAETIADEVVNQLILLTPSARESADNQLTSGFNRDQIAKLQERIVSGQQRLAEIETAINNSASEIELAALQQEKTTLEGWIIEWERNYAQLAALSEPKRNPTQLTVVEPAHSNNRVIRPRVQLNTILGSVLGMVLAIGLIFLMDFLDDTYKSVRDFSDGGQTTILGSIRKFKGRRPSDRLVAHLQPHSPITETYRIIRSRVRFKRAEQAKTIMMTSSMPGEGKSVTAANLAVVFAQTNLKTIIVDADFRQPTIHKILSVENSRGFGDLLDSSDLRLIDCLQPTSVNNLQVLPSGLLPPDPSSELGSARCKEIIADLKEMADIVLFDTPPLLLFADAIILSRRVDGVITVIQAGKSRRSEVAQALSDLRNANANILGTIFNQSPRSDTFTVNKAYMQDRPKLPFAWTWRKKDSVLHTLRESATPLTTRRPVMEMEDEDSGLKGGQVRDVGEVVEPAEASPRFQILVSDNGGDETAVQILAGAEHTSNNNHRKSVDMRALDDALEDAREMLLDTEENVYETVLPEAPVDETDGAAPSEEGLTGIQSAPSEGQVIDKADAAEAVDPPAGFESEEPVSMAMSDQESVDLETPQAEAAILPVAADSEVSDGESEPSLDDADEAVSNEIIPIVEDDQDAPEKDQSQPRRKRKNRRSSRKKEAHEVVAQVEENQPAEQTSE